MVPCQAELGEAHAKLEKLTAQAASLSEELTSVKSVKVRCCFQMPCHPATAAYPATYCCCFQAMAAGCPDFVKQAGLLQRSSTVR